MIDMNLSWTLTFDTTQLNIVLRALRGGLRPDEFKEARELANMLTQKRLQVTKSKLDEIASLDKTTEKNMISQKDV